MNVSETQIVDKGNRYHSSKLEQLSLRLKIRTKLKSRNLKKRLKQVENNTAFNEAQKEIQANNQFVADEKPSMKGKQLSQWRMTDSTATDDSSRQKTKKATQTNEAGSCEDQQAVTKYQRWKI